MENSPIPATLVEAILTEPLWLQLWLVLLILANVAAIAFVVKRQEDSWRVRKEPLAIIVSFIAAAIIMDWMYASYGYVRLLGLAHIVAWTPAYIFVLMQRKRLGLASGFGKYIHFYLLVAGLSLVVDGIDVIRYLLGDGELYLRWSG